MDRIKYPQNSLRNLARDNLNTKLFYVVDIDTLPNAKLRQKFDAFAKRVRSTSDRLFSTTVYIYSFFNFKI